MSTKNTEMTLSSPTPDSRREKLPPAYYALLAKVGVRKREASAYRDEAEHYCGIVTELLALSTELVVFLQATEKRAPGLKPLTADSTFRLHRSIKQLLNFWPQNSDSQERLLTLLDSDGLATMTGSTADGYVSLSSDQVVGNVERIIAVTKELSRRT